MYLVTWLLDGTNAMSDGYGKIIDGNWIKHNFKDFEYIISTNLPSFCKNVLNNNYFNLVNERYLKIKEYLDFDIECNFLISWITFDDKFDQADSILDQNWYLSKFEIGTNLLQTDFSDFCFIELGISWLQESKLRLAKSLNYNLHLKYLWLWIIKGIPSLVDSDSGLEITITWLENNSDLAHIFCEPNFAEFWDKNANSNWLLVTALKWRKAILFNNSSQNLIYSNYIKKWVFNIDININILTQDLDNYIVNLGSDKYLEFIKSSMPIFWKENVGNEKFYNIQKKWIKIWDLAYSIIRQLRTINYELSEYEAYRLYFSGEDKLRYDSEELIKSHAPIDNNLLNSIWKRRKSLSIAEMIVVCSLYAPLIEKRKNKTITIIFKLIIIFVLIAIIYLIFKEYSLTKKYLVNSSEINKNLNSQFSDKQNRVSSHIKELENKLNDLNKNPNNLSESEYENTLKYQNELKRLEDLSSKKIAANINSENINVYLDQAKQGSMFAEFQLAEYYSNYNDYKLASYWYKKSADQGYADAQYALAELYSNGFVVGHSLITAFELYKKAAEQGHLESIYKVAQCYQNGVGVITNFSEAVQWYTLASERGHVASMYNLGILYERGLGVDKNLNDAIKLYKSAALLNYKPAIVKLNDLNIPTNHATEGTPN